MGSGGLGWKARSTLPISGVLSILFNLKQIVLFPWLVCYQGGDLNLKALSFLFITLTQMIFVAQVWAFQPDRPRSRTQSCTQQLSDPEQALCKPQILHLSAERAYCLHGGVRFQHDVCKASGKAALTVGAQLVPSPPSSCLVFFHPQLPVSCLFFTLIPTSL